MRRLFLFAVAAAVGCSSPTSQQPVSAPVGSATQEQQQTTGNVPAMWPPDSTKGVDADGNSLELATLWKDKAAVVVFYRGAWCAYCVKQLTEIQAQLPEIEKCGLKVVAISADGPDKSRQMREELGIQFPIVSDPDLRIMEALGVRHPGQQFARPATLIVKQGGTIVYSYVGLNPSDRPPVDHILAANKCK